MFNIDSVKFTNKEAMSILKHKNEWIDVEPMCFYKNKMKEIWDNVEPIEPEKALQFSNAEQRMVAIKHIGIEKILDQVPNKVVHSETLTKRNKRWSEELEMRIDSIKDTYTLYNIELAVSSMTSTNGFITIQVVKCNDTTTGREYWLYPPPLVEEQWNREAVLHTDAITAIASTMQTTVKQEAVKCYRRQGDVFLTVVKDSWKDKEFKCEPRTITKEEYINLLESET